MAVLTTQQLVSALGGKRAAAVAVECGQWQQVVRGAYTDGRLDLATRAQAAALVLPPGAVLAGRSALWLAGAKHVDAADLRLQVVLPRGAVVPRRAGVLARQALVEPTDVVQVGEVSCLRAARAVLDVARRERLLDGVAALDATLHAGLTSPAELACELERAAGWRGVRRGREAVALADGRAESPPESRVRVLLYQAGLVTQPQFVVCDGSGCFVARLDLAVPEVLLAIEYDGRVPHEGSDAFVRDRQRQNELVALGWCVLRLTAADLRTPVALVARVIRLVETLRARQR